MNAVAWAPVARGLAMLAALLLLPAAAPAEPIAGIPLETFPHRAPTSLAAHKGCPVLINFWAPWCIPCRREFPELEALQARLKDTGVKIIGVTAEQDGKKIERFIAGTKITFDIVVDPLSALHKAVRLEALPTTVLVDAEGRLVKSYLGYSHARGLAEMERDARALAGGRR